jgi:hypothetical protein
MGDVISFRPKQTTKEFLDQYCDKNHITQKEALEIAIEKLRALEQNQPQQPITSDVPPGMPLNPEKQKAIQEFKQEQERYEVQELPLPPCNYCAKGRIDHKLGYQLIICNDPKKYKKPTEIPLPACQNCYKRKEWSKEQREREQEENPQSEPEALELPDCSNLLKGKYPNVVTEIAGKTVPPSIYCMQFGDWKTLQFCLDCFKGGKSRTISTDVAETEEQGDVDD